MVTNTPAVSPIQNNSNSKSPRTPLTPKPECSICQCVVESMDLFSVIKLSCGHVFHSDCLSEWRRHRKVSCPNCRGTMQHEFLEGRTGVTPLFSKKVPTQTDQSPAAAPNLPQPPARQRVPRQDGIYYTTPSTPNTYLSSSRTTPINATPVRSSRRNMNSFADASSQPQLTFQDLEIDVLPSLLDFDWVNAGVATGDDSSSSSGANVNGVLGDYPHSSPHIVVNVVNLQVNVEPKLNTPSIIRNALLDVDQWLAGCA